MKNVRIFLFVMTFAALNACDRTQPMSSDVREAIDRVAIATLLDRHQVYIDAKNAEGYASLYAPDGRYESPFGKGEGTAAIRKMFEDSAASGFTKGKRHMSGPASIELRGDEATAVAYYWVAETEKFPPVIVATGAYTDKLKRIDGRWKIVERRQAIDPNWLLGKR
jgi:hypothetical protein